MNRRNLVAGLGLLPLAACAGAVGTVTKTSDTVTSGATTVATTATRAATAASATNLWGIVKGVAQAALSTLTVVNPVAGLALTAAVEAGEEIASNLSTVQSDTTATAGVAASLTAQAQTVLAQAAPHVTVVPNGQA